MSRLFISYSSRERGQALALQAWLEKNGWQDEVFVDVDPDHGIAGGSAWRDALKQAAGRCEAVILMLSTAWLESRPCWSEFLIAQKHGKPIIPIKIDHLLPDPEHLPPELTANQIIDKVNTTEIEFEIRLHRALEVAGAGPENFSLPEGRKPYPGLKALTETDAALFFGRDAEVLSALDTLREIRELGTKRLFVILGASGSGKSSLLRAGLWPRINRNDRQFLVLPIHRPGNAPLTGPAGLWQVLSDACNEPRRAPHIPPGMPRTKAAINAAVDANPDFIITLLSTLQGAGFASFADKSAALPSLVFCIDQGEELLGPESGAEADQFFNLLARVKARMADFITIMAIRSDVYPRLQADARVPQEQLRPFNLSPMGQAGLTRIITGPAERVGLEVDPILHSALMRGARGADALPLLAFTLERLYDDRLDQNRLSMQDFDRLGGVAGAISAAANDVRGRAIRQGIAEGELDGLLRRVFLPFLARVNEAGEFARRLALRSEFPIACLPLVDLLVEQRLLVTDTKGDQPTVEIAHEAILREWPLLAGWLDGERSFLEWREEVTRARQAREDRQGDLLLGRSLAVAASFLETRGRDLSERDLLFIEASIEAEGRRRAEDDAEKERIRLAELAAAKAREEAALASADAEKRVAAQAKRSASRTRLFASAMTVLAVGAAGLGYYAFVNQQVAQENAVRARYLQLESESRRIGAISTDVHSRRGDDKALAVAWLALPHDEALQTVPVTDEAASAIYRRSAQPMMTIEKHVSTVFSETAPFALTLTEDRQARVWHTETMQTLAGFEPVTAARLSEDGDAALVVEADRFVVFDIAAKSASIVMALPQPASLGATAFINATPSRDGRLLLLVTDTRRPLVYDTATGRQIADLSFDMAGNEDIINFSGNETTYGSYDNYEAFNGAFFSPSGRYVSIGWAYWKVGDNFIWDVDTATLVAKVQSNSGLSNIDFDESETVAYLEGFGHKMLVRLADATTEDYPVAYIGEDFDSTSQEQTYRFVPDGQENALRARKPIVALSTDADIYDAEYYGLDEAAIADIATYPLMWSFDVKAIAARLNLPLSSAGFLPDIRVTLGSQNALADHTTSTGCAGVYDLRSGQLKTSLIPGPDPCQIVGLSHDGLTAAVETYADAEPDFYDPDYDFEQGVERFATLSVFRLDPGVPHVTTRPGRPIGLAAIGPLTAVLGDAVGGSVRIIDFAGAEIAALPSTGNGIAAIAVDTGRGFGVAGHWSGKATVFDLATGQPKGPALENHSGPISAIAVSSDGSQVAVGGHDGLVHVSDLQTGARLYSLPGHFATISSIAYSPGSGSWLTASFDATVRTWQAGREVSANAEHTGVVFAVRLSPDASLVASASEDGRVQIWAPETPADVRTLIHHEGGVRDVVWSPDGQLLLSLSDDRTAGLWRANGTLVDTLSGHIDGLVKGTFTADAKLAITGDRSGQVRIWDVETGAALASRSSDTSGVTGIALLDEDRTLMVTTAAGTIYRWPLARGGLRARIAEVGAAVAKLRPLTSEECAQYYLTQLEGFDQVCGVAPRVDPILPDDAAVDVQGDELAPPLD